MKRLILFALAAVIAGPALAHQGHPSRGHTPPPPPPVHAPGYHPGHIHRLGH